MTSEAPAAGQAGLFKRALDMLGIELEADLFARWQGPPAEHPDRSFAAADHRGNGSESRHRARLTAATNSSSPT
jgi:hypothetical protein